MMNLRRLWILTSLCSCVLVAAFFGLTVRNDFRSSVSDFEFAAKEKMHGEWVACLGEHGLTPQGEYWKLAKLCSSFDYTQTCKDSMYPLDCRNALDNACMSGLEGREPKCQGAVKEFESKMIRNRVASVPIDSLVYFVGSKYASTMWKELGLLIGGPLLLWLSPKIARRLQQWLYSN